MFLRDKKAPIVLRQPPPPPIRPLGPHRGLPIHGTNTTQTKKTLTKINEEFNKENCSSRTRKRKILSTTTNIEFLPDELIFEILVRVPAQDIYNNATWLVCRKWYRIIHTRGFIHAHLRHSNFGILTHSLQLSFLASGKGVTPDISKLNYIFTKEVMSSCNGLVLELHDQMRNICITNPITSQNFALPLFFSNVIRSGYALAYAATSMEYKVVRAFFLDNTFTLCKPESQDEHVAILTVGVDKDWTRRVNTRHLSLAAKKLFLSKSPFTTEGFVHWAQKDNRSKSVLTLNIETEVITEFALPPSVHSLGGEKELINYYFLPMGNCLSLLIERSKFSWEFWEMKPETGEWTKLPNIDLETQFSSDLNCIRTSYCGWYKFRECLLTPGGWLKFREVLVFTITRHKFYSEFFSPFFISCNVRTHEFHQFHMNGGTSRLLAHRNSLLWLGES